MNNEHSGKSPRKNLLYSAPIKSPDQRYFLDLHSKIGISKQSIQQLFWLINAPARLIAFTQVMNNLKMAVQWLISSREFGPHEVEAPFYEWIVFADYLEDNQHMIVADVGDHLLPYGSKKKKRDTHPMRQKGMTVHPLYTSLWNIHESLEHQETLTILHAHFILAHIKLLQDTTNLEMYLSHKGRTPLITSASKHMGAHNATDEACRYLRDLSLSHHQPELSEVTEAYKGKSHSYVPLYLTTRQFAEHFIALHEETHNEFQTQMETTFGLFFQHVFKPWSDQDGRNRRGGGTRINPIRYNKHDGFVQISSTLIKLQGTEIDIFDDALTQGEQHTYIESIDNDNLLGLNLADGENESGNELILIHFKETKEVPYLARLLAAEGQVRQTSLSNQLLNNRWPTMTTWEAAQLYKRLHDRLQYFLSAHHLQKADLAYLETITLIMVIMWTGSKLERAIKLGVSDTSANRGQDFVFNTQKQKILIKNKTLFYQTNPTVTQHKKSRVIEPYIILPDLGGVSVFIQCLIKHKQVQNNTHLFSSIQKTHKSRVKTFLSHIAPGHRLNIQKISTFMFHSVLQATGGDITLASLATCTTHPLSRTQLHYSTHKMNDVINAYSITASRIINSISSELKQELQQHESITYQSNETYFGSRLCPTTKNICELVSWLTFKISQPPESRALEDIIEYHNLYTIFTSQMLAYATGIRAIKHAYIPEQLIDHQTGIALISDKDGDDCYNSRLVWIPKSVLHQLSHYKAHRTEVLNMLQLLKPNASDWHSAPEMFLVDAKAKILPVQPKHVMHMIEDRFPFPMNVNRRYLRTHLIEQNCPQEVVNSFMGHWARGEEPWGKFSSLSFEDVLYHLKNHIPNILMTLGWKEHESRVQL